MSAELTGDARAAVLERIRAALGDRPPGVEVPRDYDAGLPSDVDRLARFVDRVDDYRATIERVPAERLAEVVAATLTAHAARRIVVPAGVPDEWLSAVVDVERMADDPPLTHAELDAIEGTITACAVAIAETGTIVLDAGPDQGRRALSLLPDLHVCIVRADQVVGSVPEALARLDPHRPMTWISGPSATSDIELQRVEGVHGPRRLAVILVEG